MNALSILIFATISTASWLALIMGVLGWRNVIRFHLVFDVAWFVLLKLLFFGTLEGMAIAVVGGFQCTILLWMLHTVWKKGRGRTA